MIVWIKTGTLNALIYIWLLLNLSSWCHQHPWIHDDKSEQSDLVLSCFYTRRHKFKLIDLIDNPLTHSPWPLYWLINCPESCFFVLDEIQPCDPCSWFIFHNVSWGLFLFAMEKSYVLFWGLIWSAWFFGPCLGLNPDLQLRKSLGLSTTRYISSISAKFINLVCI